MLSERVLSKTILGYSMGRLSYPTIDSMKLKGVKKVNFYVVDSNFNLLNEQLNVAVNIWKKTYNDLYEKYKNTQIKYSKYIIVCDDIDNVLYCNKITNKININI